MTFVTCISLDNAYNRTMETNQERPTYTLRYELGFSSGSTLHIIRGISGAMITPESIQVIYNCGSLASETFPVLGELLSATLIKEI